MAAVEEIMAWLLMVPTRQAPWIVGWVATAKSGGSHIGSVSIQCHWERSQIAPSEILTEEETWQ
jgi:hypothetical protein